MAAPDIKILIVDNYDSFTYNIAHTIRSFPGSNLQIIEAGKIDLPDKNPYLEFVLVCRQ
jgi:anthranilate/para-aminobenzoate synthase component II